MNRKGQVSIEYLILTGFIVLAIIVPSAIFLYSVTNQNVQGTLSNQRASDLGNGLVNDAKQIYYLGLYSNKIVEYEIPENVEYIYTLVLQDKTNPADIKTYYYFGLILFDGKNSHRVVYNFQSDVPLFSVEKPNEITHSDEGAEAYISECSAATIDCEFYSFVGSHKKPGKKLFKIETRLDGGEIGSAITPVI